MKQRDITIHKLKNVKLTGFLVEHVFYLILVLKKLLVLGKHSEISFFLELILVALQEKMGHIQINGELVFTRKLIVHLVKNPDWVLQILLLKQLEHIWFVNFMIHSFASMK